ncbi:hypothetical protein CEXT_39951 [Caerostris extrusa]|uniref:Uncharacterized protein n=1 Tax=Caerostris extrusa TaxID=172846 RepID=A0AAV4ST02_CAEEX|nr:hypothetical protein CEXT_39951 [Caerostris extrusa]
MSNRGPSKPRKCGFFRRDSKKESIIRIMFLRHYSTGAFIKRDVFCYQFSMDFPALVYRTGNGAKSRLESYAPFESTATAEVNFIPCHYSGIVSADLNCRKMAPVKNAIPVCFSHLNSSTGNREGGAYGMIDIF